MIYNVAELLTGNIGDNQKHQIKSESIEVHGHSLKEINGDVYLTRTDKTVLLDAKIKAVTNESCSRCLRPATIEVSVHMEEEFTPINSDLVDATNYDSSVEEFDSTLAIDAQNYLDITEALGQTFVATLPIAPLCKEDCLGICPTCTVNRNIIECSCSKNLFDTPWAGLAELIRKGAKSAD